MLTPDQIIALKNKPCLTFEDAADMLATLLIYVERMNEQGELLRQSLDELDRLRARLDFYRKNTFRIG